MINGERIYTVSIVSKTMPGIRYLHCNTIKLLYDKPAAVIYYFCIMKIRNDDLGKLNQLKLDLLSPPYSFRLGSIASGYINDTISIIVKYTDENNTYIQ